jgi:YidC/Oxa1 family membrane protein insertase
MMRYIRYFLYGVLIMIGLLLWDTWQQEHSVVVQETQAPKVIDHQQLKHDPQSLRKISSQQVVKASEEQLVRVTTDVLSVDIDKQGGKIVRVVLLKYPKELHADESFLLLNDAADTFYIAGDGLLKANGLEEDQEVFQYQADKKAFVLSEDKPLSVVLRAKGPNGLYLTKTFIFNPRVYEIKNSMQVTNQSKKAWSGNYYMQLSRQVVSKRQKGFLATPSFFGVAISSPERPYHKISFSHLQKESLHENIQGGWLAMIQHYFLGAWIPDNQELYHYYSRVTADGVYTVGMVGKKVTLSPKESVEFKSKFYAGPKIAEQLEKVAPHLELTVDYSSIALFSLLSMFIFNMMRYVYKVVGNWGWAIVIITVFIRLLFYRLSVKSYRSMAGMKKLQPKIQQLKERFGSDRQSMSRAMIELYRKEKINPLGGCLPILVQIPVFFALYWVLIESVELRQAPFVFWIRDLSAKDPYYILPILMGLSMFIQQKLSPQAPDPTQAKVMMFLPVLMTVLFLNFPAGLVLYWVVNNGLSILQQWYVTKKFERGDYHVIRKRKK